MRSNDFANRIAGRTDLITELQPLESIVEIYGKQRVLIENHHGICEYTDQQITVALKCGRFCISGDGLQVVLMTKNRLVIQGLICNAAFCKEER